jgi:hypothetical protein
MLVRVLKGSATNLRFLSPPYMRTFCNLKVDQPKILGSGRCVLSRGGCFVWEDG